MRNSIILWQWAMHHHGSDEKGGDQNSWAVPAKRWQFLLGRKRMTGMGHAPEDVQVSPMRIWNAAGHDILAPTRRVAAWRYQCSPASPSPQRDVGEVCTIAKTMLCAAIDMMIELLHEFQRYSALGGQQLEIGKRTRSASVTCGRAFPILPIWD